MNVFTGHEPSAKHSWIGLSDIETEVKNGWINQLPRSIKFPFTSREFDEMNNAKISNVFEEVISPVSRTLTQSHAFFLTTPDSKLLNVVGSVGVIKRLCKAGIHNGVSFEIFFAGINAVSVCQMTGQTVVIRGYEHTLKFFLEWTCVCTPICVQKQIVGLLDLSFHKIEDIQFAVPLVLQTARDISETLATKANNGNLENFYLKFEQFYLTKREKDIAFAWLNNQTVPQIADTYSISGHTVRTVIKNIYSKVDVGNKVDFIYKFHDMQNS